MSCWLRVSSDTPMLAYAEPEATGSEELAVSVAIGLITPKVLGQAGVAATRLGRKDVAENLRDIADCLDGCSTLKEVGQLEATAAGWYFGAWLDSPAAIPRFTKADTKRVPPHWCSYHGRRSLLSSKGNINRKADRPTNVVLNYLLKLVDIEARLACVSVVDSIRVSEIFILTRPVGTPSCTTSWNLFDLKWTGSPWISWPSRHSAGRTSWSGPTARSRSVQLSPNA